MKRVLLTGAGGFIGAHVLEHLLHETDWQVTATDSFRHKGKTDRIRQVLEAGPGGWRERTHVVMHDLAAPVASQLRHKIGHVDYVLALASLSHVDDSIADPVGFTRNNTDIALSALEYAREARPGHLIWVSTDEVYGPVEAGQAHREWAPILPSNPYSASKAAQEALAIAYWRTYGVPLSIVNSMNLIGERQGPEKFLPSLVRRISRGETVTVHGSPGNIGTRHYLHARNLADAMLYIMRNLPPAVFPAHRQPELGAGPVTADRPDRFNIVGPDRVSNLQLAQMVADIIGKPLRYRLEDFHTTRPGHDPHYGLDGSKLAALGWKPPVPFAESLARTVQWALSHPEWLEE
jgi:dTDP-glucose 4,6-dehydratase